MAMAAEPAWLSGNAVALAGSVIFFAVALGAGPTALLRLTKGVGTQPLLSE